MKSIYTLVLYLPYSNSWPFMHRQKKRVGASRTRLTPLVKSVLKGTADTCKIPLFTSRKPAQKSVRLQTSDRQKKNLVITSPIFVPGSGLRSEVIHIQKEELQQAGRWSFHCLKKRFTLSLKINFWHIYPTLLCAKYPLLSGWACKSVTNNLED